MLAVVFPVALVAGASPAAAATEPTHGLVGTFCDPQRVTSNKAAGVQMVVLSARWDLMFPTRGVVDPNYRTAFVNALRTCVNGGLRVVVDAGLQYTPAWATALTNARLRDQYGSAPVSNQLDLIYNAGVRTAAAEYLTELVKDLPASTVEAIRVGTTTTGELGLPGSWDGGKGHDDSWWAFSPAAQNGTGLAAGQTKSPMPGWIPGQTTWKRRAVTTADALNWWRWYERAVVQTESWLAQTVRGAGFSGPIHLPVAGRGVLPAEITQATSSSLLLFKASSIDDSFARGLDYVDQMPRIKSSISNVVIDLTSVDDATAVTARGLSPAQDNCQLDDASTSQQPSTNVAQWSNLRFARSQVALAGLPAVGENPGPPAPETGGVANSDSEAQQLSRSPGYARSCGLAALLFAFEDDLYTGRSGITAADYTNAW